MIQENLIQKLHKHMFCVWFYACLRRVFRNFKVPLMLRRLANFNFLSSNHDSAFLERRVSKNAEILTKTQFVQIQLSLNHYGHGKAKCRYRILVCQLDISVAYVQMTIKMLLKPLVLQHFRKKKLCGCSAVVRPTTKLQPQNIFFVNVVKPMVLATFIVVLSARRGEHVSTSL